MRRILLVEPAYNTKYPPLGLMKISSYHKLRGDRVYFVRGPVKAIQDQQWDRIYISTLFTYYWQITVKTIRYYMRSVKSPGDIYVGGILATLLSKELEQETDAHIITGLLDKPGILDEDDRLRIDELIPDYQILSETEYKYPVSDYYLAYATRGCPNSCDFCAVNKIEPDFIHYLPIKRQIIGIETVFGSKQNLILLDNNVLASNSFERIIYDLIDLGFFKGATFGRTNRKRRIDFNQGTDSRYLSTDKMALLSKIAIDPLRIAFDHIELKDLYISKIQLAKDYGILNLSNYVLFNYKDTPKDFYERLRINILLNEELGTKIYSFPMKYVPLDAKDRSFVGKYWNKKILRGIQCILIPTKGLVGTNKDYFEAAFGSSHEDFIKIALMPEHYIINRKKYANNGALDWVTTYDKLTINEKNEFLELIKDNRPREIDTNRIYSLKVKRLLSHYINSENTIADTDDVE